MIVTDSGSVHSGAKFSPMAGPSKPYTGSGEAYRQAMNAFAPLIPEVHRPGAVSIPVADALIAALRSPAHAAPVLRPIADELEARRAGR